VTKPDSHFIGLIADGARDAFTELFSSSGERFYYCTLITTGEAHCPFASAWSYEALDRTVEEVSTDEDNEDLSELRANLKWSYADSPYDIVGEEHFDEARAAFEALPGVENYGDAWPAEWERRVALMEAAMRRLDDEGLWGNGAIRDATVVLVEVMPPDASNTERAGRLNPRSNPTFQEWLAEIAERD
jgi:hypothetical protein